MRSKFPPPVRTREQISTLSTEALKRVSENLREAIRRAEKDCPEAAGPLKKGLAEVEAELIDRLIDQGRQAEVGEGARKYVRNGLHLMLMGSGL